DGQYTFVCVLHPAMNGVLTIGKKRETPADVRKAAKSLEAKAMTAAADIKQPPTERTQTTATITTGWGTPAVSYNLFTPLQVTVPVGTTVKWVDRHPEEPHTVTFETPFSSPEDPRVVAPGGVKSGSAYSGGF